MSMPGSRKPPLQQRNVRREPDLLCWRYQVPRVFFTITTSNVPSLRKLTCDRFARGANPEKWLSRFTARGVQDGEQLEWGVLGEPGHHHGALPLACGDEVAVVRRLVGQDPMFGPKAWDFSKFPTAGAGIEEILEKEVANDALH